MTANQMFPFAFTLALAQGMAAAWHHARVHDAWRDLDAPVVRQAAAPALRMPDWLLQGMEEEAAAGALEDPELAALARATGMATPADAAVASAPQRP